MARLVPCQMYVLIITCDAYRFIESVFSDDRIIRPGKRDMRSAYHAGTGVRHVVLSVLWRIACALNGDCVMSGGDNPPPCRYDMEKGGLCTGVGQVVVLSGHAPAPPPKMGGGMPVLYRSRGPLRQDIISPEVMPNSWALAWMVCKMLSVSAACSLGKER